MAEPYVSHKKNIELRGEKRKDKDFFVDKFFVLIIGESLFF